MRCCNTVSGKGPKYRSLLIAWHSFVKRVSHLRTSLTSVFLSGYQYHPHSNIHQFLLSCLATYEPREFSILAIVGRQALLGQTNGVPNHSDAGIWITDRAFDLICCGVFEEATKLHTVLHHEEPSHLQKCRSCWSPYADPALEPLAGHFEATNPAPARPTIV